METKKFWSFLDHSIWSVYCKADRFCGTIAQKVRSTVWQHFVYIAVTKYNPYCLAMWIYSTRFHIYIYIYIYMCVCVCVCAIGIFWLESFLFVEFGIPSACTQGLSLCLLCRMLVLRPYYNASRLPVTTFIFRVPQFRAQPTRILFRL
jgi:hypothetical protein